jgi:hypothetical protein
MAPDQANYEKIKPAEARALQRANSNCSSLTWQCNFATARVERRKAGLDLPALAAATTAAASATTAAATVTTTTAASATTTAATTVALRTSFINGDRATVDLCAVERFDRGPAFIIVRHGYECETTWAAGIAIRNHGHFFHLAVGPKLGLQRLLRR